MYAWIWRQLPGPTPLKAVTSLAIAVGIVIVLFLWGFPLFEELTGFGDVAVRE
ncbi:MAG TPA: hypothetical protein VFZ37_00220 [Jiangellaceae bacterium]